MPAIVPIKFDASFESSEPQPLHIGRLQLGPHIARLLFCPDGQMKLAISKAAIADGSIILIEHSHIGPLGVVGAEQR